MEISDVITLLNDYGEIENWGPSEWCRTILYHLIFCKVPLHTLGFAERNVDVWMPTNENNQFSMDFERIELTIVGIIKSTKMEEFYFYHFIKTIAELIPHETGKFHIV